MIKSRDAFRTISEVADWLDTPAHVLRFWESKFPQIRPVKRAGGRRYYRPEDMALLGGIKALLHDQGMTIKGVQKLLREQGPRHVMALGPQGLPQVTETFAAEEPAAADAVAGLHPEPDLAPPAAPVPQTHPPARAAEPAPLAPEFLAALARADRRSLLQRTSRIAPLLARLTAVRDRMARI